MKHLIIINRSSGNDDKNKIENQTKEAFKDLDYEIHFTEGPKEATSFLRDYFKKETKETVRVYACGGDGTVNEAVNGIVGAKNAELAVLATGTGNDFVKVYGGHEKFLSFNDLINGEVTPIDLSKIESPSLKEPMYSVNVINFGFDAVVGAMGNVFKDQGKKDPYGKALKVAMLKARFNSIKVWGDGEELNKKRLLLCTLAQGQYVGGKFHCAPKSNNADGLMDLCLIKTMCFAHLGMIIGPYTAGKHLDKPNKKFVYRQVKEAKIVAPKDIDICVDGEMVKGKEFIVTIDPKAINFVVPKAK